MSEKVLVADAWPYVNGDLHPGHFAGHLLPADFFARYQRLKGNDVLMVSGSDCYGTPITLEADKKKLTPKEVVDIYHKKDIELFNTYGISYNLYTKTSTDNHIKVFQDMFVGLYEHGYIIKNKTKQYYSEADNKFLPDRYVEGTCPNCGAIEQRSDQCEVCGQTFEPGEILDPVSKLTGAKVILKETEHYFLDFPKFQKDLEKFVNDSKQWRTWVRSEALGWLKKGLEPRSMTRDLDWGVPIPKDRIKSEDWIDNIESKRFYVWYDAVTGYLSAAIEWSKLNKGNSSINPDEYIYNKFDGQSDAWEDWWKDPNSKHYYFMGKDNLFFHTLQWPAQLMGYDNNLTLPYFPAINQFMNLKGKKFSKSRNWVIDSLEIAKKYGVDSVRYYLATTLPENRDGNFTWEDFVATNNNELVATFGNFVHRVLTFVNSKFEGKINKYEVDQQVMYEIRDTFKDTQELFEKVELVEAVKRTMKLAQFGNKYFNDSKVWEVIKQDKKEAERLIYNSIQIINALRVLFYPFVPNASNSLSTYINLKPIEYKVDRNLWKFVELKDIAISQNVQPLFAKIDEKVVETENSKLG